MDTPPHNVERERLAEGKERRGVSLLKQHTVVELLFTGLDWRQHSMDISRLDLDGIFSLVLYFMDRENWDTL